MNRTLLATSLLWTLATHSIAAPYTCDQLFTVSDIASALGVPAGKVSFYKSAPGDCYYKTPLGLLDITVMPGGEADWKSMSDAGRNCRPQPGVPGKAVSCDDSVQLTNSLGSVILMIRADYGTRLGYDHMAARLPNALERHTVKGTSPQTTRQPANSPANHSEIDPAEMARILHSQQETLKSMGIKLPTLEEFANAGLKNRIPCREYLKPEVFLKLTGGKAPAQFIPKQNNTACNFVDATGAQNLGWSVTKYKSEEEWRQASESSKTTIQYGQGKAVQGIGSDAIEMVGPTLMFDTTDHRYRVSVIYAVTGTGQASESRRAAIRKNAGLEIERALRAARP